jgi:AmiR/NasT family two-component response regulator
MMKKATEFQLQAIDSHPSLDGAADSTAESTHHDQRRLNCIAYLGRDCSGVLELASQGINVVSSDDSSIPPDVLDVVDAVLVDFDILKPIDRAYLLLEARRRRIPIVTLRDRVAGAIDCVDGGADATAPSSASADELAAALWSAQKQSKIRYELQQRIDDLEMEVVQAALVERATIVLSSQSQTSQAESLKLLRSEARRQRRPMWELAKVVLAADDILAARSSQKSVDR